jgi:pimeloyl-ACP methyl ester carboxylesterase
MTNPLIAERDAFAARHPETAFVRQDRRWGVIDTGSADSETDRPALLLLPGTLGRGDVFFKQIKALAPEIRVLAVSYPASGKLACWIDDLAALIDARGMANIAVLGTSLGGYIAQMFAALRPALVSHLFAANTLPSVAELDQRKPFSLDLWHAPISELRDGFGDTLRLWRASHPDDADLIDLLFAELNGRIPEPELRARMDVLKGADELPPCPLPPAGITVIDAADDPLIPPEWRARVRHQQNAGATFRFQTGGHFPYLARPALYTAVIRNRLGLAPLPAEWGAGPDHTA